ncbi:hypothetical protein KCP71_11905 [Salmonella enterica subsp. enterica]|nr:hypothetical protein KCP71_11905 [Salmonella enterica subsp. enterica]
MKWEGRSQSQFTDPKIISLNRCRFHYCWYKLVYLRTHVHTRNRGHWQRPVSPVLIENGHCPKNALLSYHQQIQCCNQLGSVNTGSWVSSVIMGRALLKFPARRGNIAQELYQMAGKRRRRVRR